MDNQPIVNNTEPINDKIKFLSADDNTTAAIILVEKACEQYQTLYKKNNVPFSYVNFFCEEFNKYSGLFTEKLKTFYQNYTSLGISAEDLIDRYTKSYYSQHKEIKVTKDEKFLCFDTSIVLTFTKEMREVTNIGVSTMVENIINICHKIDSQDELVSLIELYERYMIAQYVNDYKIKLSKRAQKEQEAIQAEAAETNTTDSDSFTLVGSALEDKYESHGKITKIIIPKLNLPSAYPISLEQSRISPNNRSSLFCTPAKQIVFINRKKIVAVKYSNKFLEKRTAQKPKKKFDWDF